MKDNRHKYMCVCVCERERERERESSFYRDKSEAKDLT